MIYSMILPILWFYIKNNVWNAVFNAFPPSSLLTLLGDSLFKSTSKMSTLFQEKLKNKVFIMNPYADLSSNYSRVSATSFSLAEATVYRHTHSKYSGTALFYFKLTDFILLFSWRRLLQITIPGRRDWRHYLVKETWKIKRMRCSNGKW